MRRNHVTNGTIRSAFFKANLMSFICLLLCCLIGTNHGLLQLSQTSLIKHVGENFLINCQDRSGRQVSWTGPKGLLGPNTHPKVAVASYGTSIMFSNVNTKDAGEYVCKADKESKQFHLIVRMPLTFMDTSPVQVGVEYSPVTLRCEVKGDDAGDKPILSWSVDNKEINDPRYEIIGDGLLIRNVSRSDSKTFTCKALQSSTGDFREQKIQLKVEHKPTFKSPVYAKSEDVWGLIGHHVNLTCEVDAEPPPKFEWTRKKQKLTENIINEGSHKSILQIHIKDASILGVKYMCKVHNKIGTLEKIFHLQQGIQAPPPEFIELRGENADLLDIGIRASNATSLPYPQNPTGYRVEYKPKHDKHWKYIDFEINEDNSYPLQNLHHSTDYEVRAATRNVAGLSTYTDTSIFRTLTSQTDTPVDGAAPASPRTLITYASSIVALLAARFL